MSRTFSCLVCFSRFARLVHGDETPAVVRLTKDGDFKQHLQWSPDGKRFLLTRIHAGKMGLWVMNADGSDLKPLLHAAAPYAALRRPLVAGQ